MENEKKFGEKLSYFTDMIYVGKEWHKDFNNEDGTVTKSYRYNFKKQVNDQYPIRFWGYNTTKGAEILSEGEKFNVGYINSPNPKGDAPIKSAKFFGVPKENNQQQQQQQVPMDTTPQPTGLPEIAPEQPQQNIQTQEENTQLKNVQYKEYVASYNAKYTPEQRTLNHAMLVWFAYKHTTEKEELEFELRSAGLK